MTARLRLERILFAALLALASSGCAVRTEPEDGVPDAPVREEPPLEEEVGIEEYRDVADAPALPGVRDVVMTKQAGCPGCGPVPDPWKSVAGPVPDPWDPDPSHDDGRGKNKRKR